ncbi:iron-sulfur-binding reductase [Candidatus Methylomirabilis limnetica]|uniref:Iron-sulfur-binding reductase n=1 Tax=Candidatus Methylomirabilis limnetica TaxID=2033718 RepID=A0A2T4TV48_9BACT|nr:heterodisulfide reductase-related iron-sulfur binding cluster [Candidatus Methylomirabilis limnetica]PTL34990.1 iron-sulfur-binding reductase [Candidatus Methylomirabilis limnetica]
MIPMREIYWNIPGHLFLYLLFFPFLVVWLYGIYRHTRMILMGEPAAVLGSMWDRLKGVVEDAVLQRRIAKDTLSGLLHRSISWGFAILFIATCLVALQDYLGIPTLRGSFYLYFMSLTVDLFGLVAIVGVLMALARRYGLKPDRLLLPRKAKSYDALLALLLISLVTGFLIEGLRIAATADPWGRWSPGGWLASVLFRGTEQTQQVALHQVLWWFHAAMAFTFIALLPYGVGMHVTSAAANILLKNQEGSGVLRTIDLDRAAHFGAGAIDQFTWKDLLDLEACTECGRCQQACPAWATGKPLTPKGVIIDLRDHMRLVADGDESRKMVGEVISHDVLWACTTCGACHQECPIFIEPIPKIIEMRRHLVMEEANFPETMQQALRSLEERGHPFRGTSASRTDWAKGLGVKTVAENGPPEILYWVGCAAAFDERNQQVAAAFAKLLQRAGVDFAILGEEERCTGDPARRIGNEYLFQALAKENIAILNGYGIKKIVTTCPHGFNTLKNEYPKLGGSYEVVHHTQMLADLVKEGRLRPEKPIDGVVSFHDPCYLGRHNGIYDPPRQLLGAIPGLVVKEMDRCREGAFCCGAGGGLMWFEEKIGKRVSWERTEEALALEPQVLASACPYCLIMFEDALKVKDAIGRTRPLDVAELMAQSMDM